MTPKSRNCLISFLLVTIAYIASAFSSETSSFENRVSFIEVSIGNIRLRPATNSSIIAKLQKGDKLTIVGKEGDWYMVKLPDNRLGWAHQMLIRKKIHVTEPEEIEAPDKVRIRATLSVSIGRVRAQPSLDSAIKFKLKKGDTVDVIERTGDWYLIGISDGRTGWAHKSLFTDADNNQMSSEQTYKEIQAIYTQVLSEEEEKVIFVLNDSFTPKTFVVTGDKPKVICDFFNVHLGSKVEPKIEVDGSIIQQISLESFDTAESGIRIVLNLVPDNNYNVQPLFYKKNNYYALVIKRSL